MRRRSPAAAPRGGTCGTHPRELSRAMDSLCYIGAADDDDEEEEGEQSEEEVEPALKAQRTAPAGSSSDAAIDSDVES